MNMLMYLCVCGNMYMYTYVCIYILECSFSCFMDVNRYVCVDVFFIFS